MTVLVSQWIMLKNSSTTHEALVAATLATDVQDLKIVAEDDLGTLNHDAQNQAEKAVAKAAAITAMIVASEATAKLRQESLGKIEIPEALAGIQIETNVPQGLDRALLSRDLRTLKVEESQSRSTSRWRESAIVGSELDPFSIMRRQSVMPSRPQGGVWHLLANTLC